MTSFTTYINAMSLPRRSTRIARQLAWTLSLVGSSALWAADPVTDAMQQAYAPYRAALFKTNSNAPAEAQQAIEQAQKTWTALTTRFGKAPAAPYDRDAGFAQSLSQVSLVYERAAGQIAKGQLADAHATLEEAREVMAELRHRNNVVVYSDHMNAYHAQMEHLLETGDKLLAAPRGLLELTAQVGALDYLAQRLSSEAPAELKKNDAVVAQLKQVDQSVAALKAALLAQDAGATKTALGKLKAPYSKLFLIAG